MSIRRSWFAIVLTVAVGLTGPLSYSRDIHPHAVIDTKFGSIETEPAATGQADETQ
jgi:hypothetical protein